MCRPTGRDTLLLKPNVEEVEGTLHERPPAGRGVGGAAPPDRKDDLDSALIDDTDVNGREPGRCKQEFYCVIDSDHPRRLKFVVDVLRGLSLSI